MANLNSKLLGLCSSNLEQESLFVRLLNSPSLFRHPLIKYTRLTVYALGIGNCFPDPMGSKLILPTCDPQTIDKTALEPESREISISVNERGQIASSIKGRLAIPDNPRGIIIFAHGSGSGKHSPRNQYVARVLNSAGLATALFDLLTEEEAAEDERTKKLRFDIELLTDRLIKITEWAQDYEETRDLKMGYYGASTGAASALFAAAHFGDKIKTIVSRGGRVDLAASTLKQVNETTSILFLVGSNDPATIKWNENVMKQLKQVVNKRLVLVQGAGHLFEEEGKLEEVAKHSASWFRLSFS